MKFTKPALSTLAFLLFMFSCQKENTTIDNNTPSNTQAIYQNQSATTIVETFETGTKTAYATANVTLSTGVWNFNDALLGNSTSDRKEGSQSARVRNSGILSTNFDYPSGASTVTVLHALFGNDASSTWQLWYSTNAGSTYTQSGGTITTSSTTLQTASFTINVSGNVRFQIRKTDGSSNRINFDNFSVTSYGGVVSSPTLTSVSPDSATSGGAAFTLTATGGNFVSGSTINWNGVALTTTYVSATKLTAAVAASYISTTGTDSISVSTPSAGSSASVAFYVKTATAAGATLTKISPVTANAGGAAFTITATGTKFVSTSTLNWNGVALATTYVSAKKLTATVPTTDIAVAGTDSVNVTTPGATGSASLPFVVEGVGVNNPTLSSISPSSATAGAAAFTLTATGTNYTSASTINWNGTALTTTYVSATKLTSSISATLITTAGTASVTVATPGATTSAALTFTINPKVVGTGKRFLFDATKAETAGNADWVIDEDNSTPQQIPTPAQSTVTASTVETYWTGALSSFGIALVKLGHTVQTLPSTGSITYGNASNPQDLSNYDVYVVDEPNIVFTTAEKTAILNFISHGGGLFMVSDHTGSDRNNDGWDSPAIWNDFMTNNGIQVNPFGFSVDLTNISGLSTNVLTNGSSNPILNGSQGSVSEIEFNNGATLTLEPSANAAVQGLVWQSTYTQDSTHVLTASSTYGSGRVYVITDSSPLDDGTGAPDNTLYVSWPLYSHTQLFMNASLWLAKVQ